METSEGFEDFLYEIGINWFNRKAQLDDWGVDDVFIEYIIYLQMACTAYPTAKISQDAEGQITIQTWSHLRSHQKTFRLQQPYQV